MKFLILINLIFLGSLSQAQVFDSSSKKEVMLSDDPKPVAPLESKWDCEYDSRSGRIIWSSCRSNEAGLEGISLDPEGCPNRTIGAIGNGKVELDCEPDQG